ncbi:MAG: hypothetical protein K6C99_03305 [Lachnospiraceae bacterium]|nr:hypothetical protein [Lachnospiraceae bacterium]
MELNESFCTRMSGLLGDDYNAYLDSFDHEAVKAFHLNDAVISADDFLGFESGLDDIDITVIPDSPCGYYYKSDQIGKTPAHHAGMIYSQDPSAMAVLAGIDLDDVTSPRILDLCAAPGGKTSQLAAAVKGRGVVIANEPNPSRNQVLCSNIERMGYENVIVTRCEPSEIAAFYPSYFDLILADVPCSGEGMFRKYPESVNEWSTENIKNCVLRSRDILENAVSMLRPGGRLIFSTCTYAPEENEETCAYLTKELGLQYTKAPEYTNKYALHSKIKGGEGYRFYPHLFKGEGQFASYFVKPGSCINTSSKSEINLKNVSGDVLKQIETCFGGMPDIDISRLYVYKDRIIYLSEGIDRLPPRGITMAGINIGWLDGKNKGKNFTPHHHVFSSLGRKLPAFVELGSDKALMEAYLRGEEIRPDDRLAENSVLKDKCFGAVLFAGVPAGGFKFAGGKLKNHYPKGLRNLR